MKRLFNKLVSVFFILLLTANQSVAQSINIDSFRTVQQHIIDSSRTAQKHYTDSVRTARQHYLDSIRTVRTHQLDSAKKVRELRLDSLKTIRDYRQSQHYKDSVAAFRQHYQDSLKTIRQHRIDSIRVQRKHYTDSLMAVRKQYNDSIRNYLDSLRTVREKELILRKAAQQRRSDSIAAIRVYRESKPYQDSIHAIRQYRIDSMTQVRKHYTDSIRAVRTATLDSMKAVRQKYNDSLRTYLDSLRAERQRQTDSMAQVRQVRMDSLAKVRAARKAEQEVAKKEKEKKKKLQLEITIKQKKKEYSNDKMLKKKWSLPRQIVQNTFTRYNYYFNANEKMEEAVANMLRSKIDNFDSLIDLFPFDPNIDSAKLSSDMDTIIRKASLGIQIHDPRAKWQANLYLLVGQAYYYKADYENAGSSFKQIVAQAEAEKKKENKKKSDNKEDGYKPISYGEPDKTGLTSIFAHQSVKNEAILWLSRTFVQSDKQGQAQTLLDILKNDPNFPDRLNGRLALEQAFLEIKRNNYNEAIQPLSIVSEDKDLPQWIRLRSSYLAGQIAQNNHEPEKSTLFFKTALSLHPKIDMDFYAHKNIAFNDLKVNPNAEEAQKLLNSMIKDGKYHSFIDQIYFALAKTDLNNQDIPNAITHLQKSIQSSNNNRKQKGYSFSLLGDIYYNQKKYNQSKLSYDSATLFLTPAQNPVYDKAKKRSLSLNQITGLTNIIAQQDSLLHLASLSEKEQRAMINDYLKALRKHITDSVFIAENTTNNPAANIKSTMNNPNVQSWYFSNPILVQKGINEFKQKWGDRQLKDNWRQSSGISSFDNQMTNNNNSINSSNNILDNLPDEDSLYAAIPHTPEALAISKGTLSEALFLLGKGYYTYLEDFDNALQTFDTLNHIFPQNKHQAEVLYERYLIAMRQHKKTEANQYNSQLQTQFPNSEWARLLASVASTKANQNVEKNALQKKATGKYYDETYQLLTERQYTTVLNRIDSAEIKFPHDNYFQKRYALIKAVATAGIGNYPKSDSMLTGFLIKNANDSLATWAHAVLNFVKGREPNSTIYRDSVSTAQQAAERAKLSYTFQPNATHFVVIIAPADMRMFALKSGLQDYNLLTPGRKSILVNMTTFNTSQNMILCKSFKTASEAKEYTNELRRKTKLFREYPSKEYNIILISSDNFTIFKQKMDLNNYMNFYQKNYK